MGEWVLIFVQISQSVPIFGVPAVNVQPIYFQTQAACAAVANEFNNGPESSKDSPKKGNSTVFGAICRGTK